MFHIVLFRPEIPPNTGNVIRLAANTGCTLHLVRPLGFDLEGKAVRRAGLDYDELAKVRIHPSLDECFTEIASGHALHSSRDRVPDPPATAPAPLTPSGAVPSRVFSLETTGSRPYSAAEFHPGDVFLFGSEHRGLPPTVLERVPRNNQLTIPMRPGNRSLNLSNAVALVIYEAWRQNGFTGAEAPRSVSS